MTPETTYTLGQLLAEVERCERVYQQELERGKALEAKGTILGVHLARDKIFQAELNRFKPAPSRMPGIGRIELLCDERFGARITAEAVRKLRAELCRRCGLSIRKTDALTLDEVADKLQPESPGVTAKTRLSSEEFNPLARDYLSSHATSDHRVTARELADYLKSQNPAGTCSTSTVRGLPAWRAYQDELERSGQKGRKNKPRAVAFTDKVEATTGERDRELDRLIQEQRDHMEPSPLEDDPPGAAPRKVKERKRV
jgi:hypothetical protein